MLSSIALLCAAKLATGSPPATPVPPVPAVASVPACAPAAPVPAVWTGVFEEDDWESIGWRRPEHFELATDSTFQVPAGTRLKLETFAGDIVVKTWQRSAVRVEAQHERRDRIVGRVLNGQGGPVFVLGTQNRTGRPSVVDYALTVPRWMGLELNGMDSDITVEGTEAPVQASSVRGDVHVRGGRGAIQLASVEGDVSLDGGNGQIQASSVNSGLRLLRVNGSIEAQTVNGDIQLDELNTEDLEASTVNGTVTFSGPMRGKGRYRLTSHNGDLVVGFPEHSGANVRVNTYQGQFQSVFPVMVERSAARSRLQPAARKYAFKVGTGDSQLDLESFQGLIRLVRAKELKGLRLQLDELERRRTQLDEEENRK